MPRQDAFARALLDPAHTAPAGLTNPDGAPASKRFDVYRNNVAVSLTEALEVTFPVIRKLVGEANFRTLAAAFLRSHPPETPLLMQYGESLPGFLEGFEPVRSLPYLADVARLEIALVQSFHAADAAPLPPVTLQNLPADRLMAARLILAPATRLVRSRWPVHQIWRYNTETGAAKPRGEGENVLVTRPEFDPAATTLAPGGGTFLAALMGGARFGAAVAEATEAVAEFDLTAALGALLAGAAITGIDEDS